MTVTYPSNVVFNEFKNSRYTSYYDVFALNLNDPATAEFLARYTVLMTTKTCLNQDLVLLTENKQVGFSLYFNASGYGGDEFSLCGKGTLAKRKEARKVLLHGLGSAIEYDNNNKTIEDVRRDTLYAFSEYIAANSCSTLSLQNYVTPLTTYINTWLVKMLG